MFSFIKKLFSLLTLRERRQLYYLFAAMVLMAVIEVVGVGSIMPFMAVVSNPDIIVDNKWLHLLFNLFEFPTRNSFLLFLGCCVLAILLVNNICTAAITWMIFKYSWLRNHSISKRLLKKYLYEPYVFFLNRNTADLEKNIMDEVRVIIAGILDPLLMMIKNTVLMLFLFTLLLFIDPLLSIMVSVIIGGAYGILFAFVSKKLNRIGVERAEANKHRFKVANEALCGVKILKVLGREDHFISEFSIHSRKLSENQALKSVISQIPKYAFEVIAFGGILLIVLYHLAKGTDTAHVIPLLSLYAFAGYRLMPALQSVFTGVAEIRYTLPALNLLYDDITNGSDEKDHCIARSSLTKPLSVKKDLALKDIEFAYPDQQEKVLRKLNLSIGVNTTIGLVGSTGSGKTTLVDIILGLLRPSDGKLLVDGIVINDTNLEQWQKNIGYVPQEIFLSDDTISANIGFGIAAEDLDQKAVIQAAKVANLHNFITSELPDGYNTPVGERGIRLSGGQRQRIGIARALYYDPEVLVLDEATSALDGATEDVVIQAIHDLSHKKTIIMIAHRITTLQECDEIFVLDGGRIIAQGDYQDLINSGNMSHSKKLSKDES